MKVRPFLSKPRFRSKLPEKDAKPRSGLSFTQTLIVAVVSTGVTLLVSTFTGALTQAMAIHFTNEKEGTFERRAKLEQLLTLSYGLTDDLRKRQLKHWMAAMINAPKLTTESHGDTKWLEAMYTEPSENLSKFRALGVVYFPEIDSEIIGVTNAYLAAEQKGFSCMADQLISEAKKRPRKMALKNLFPSVSCVTQYQNEVGKIDVEGRKLIDAARVRLRVYFFDPAMVPKNSK